MATSSNRLAISITAVALWVAVTMGLALLQVAEGTSLGQLVSQQIVWGPPAAAALLLVIMWAMKWTDVGFNAVRPASSWRLIWFPMLIIAGFFVTSIFLHPPIPAAVLLTVTVNTMFVGFSEELAFRGVLWGAARKALPFWGAFFLVTFLFGIVHVLNALLTGEFAAAGVQAFNAMLSGSAFLALRIRTHALLPVMIVHWLWDLSVFLLLSGHESPGPAPAPLEQLLGALVIVGPMALYGFYLIRNGGARAGWQDDHAPSPAFFAPKKGE
ncbi:CPBP family intramembrane glutamic endopeptidase [Sphingorhabdus contaminans]|uniref:CPBP family intramembrane glutamic endopeptidase n=1 Tax=Sphingorhabdus contaminans TaxID=1343899 RepID=UPI003D28A256